MCVCVGFIFKMQKHEVFRCRHRLFHLPILTNYWILGSQGARDVLCFASRLGAEQFNNFQNHKVFEDHERCKVLCFCCGYYLRPAYAYVGRIVATPWPSSKWWLVEESPDPMWIGLLVGWQMPCNRCVLCRVPAVKYENPQC